MTRTVNDEPMEVVIYKGLEVDLTVGKGVFEEPEFLHSKAIVGWEEEIFIFRVGLIFDKLAKKYYNVTGKYISFAYNTNQNCVNRQKEILADIKNVIKSNRK